MSADRIRTFSFNAEGQKQLSSTSRGRDWPVVYLLHNNKDLYIGETTSAATRMAQHLLNKDKQRKKLKLIEIVLDDEFNKSVILDFEQKLIKCYKTDTRFKNILNLNAGQSSSHDYYDRSHYNDVFRDLWEELQRKNLATKALSAIENENIFKYSPYSSLTESQNIISTEIIRNITESLKSDTPGISLVNGCAGTGKSVLAISLINSLVNVNRIEELDLTEDNSDNDKIVALQELNEVLKTKKQHLKIGFLMPMSGIRKTFQDVFKDCGNGLTSDMVIGPADLGRGSYDILFVDESHRLSTRKNIVNHWQFCQTAEKLGFHKDRCSQLDWVIKQAKYKVLFYDKDQSVKGSDISVVQFEKTVQEAAGTKKEYLLETQMRCRGGGTYVDYVKDIMNVRNPEFKEINNYRFRLFDDVGYMYSEICACDKKYGLCRCVAGYSWKWTTQNRPKSTGYDYLVQNGLYDIEIDGHKFIWNLKNADWINDSHSLDTIGCIHSTQGYDLNYVGVIFGREIDYDPATDSIAIDMSKLFDMNVKKNTTPEVLKRYIINTYTTILARGIHGCYVYACNKNLQDYLSRFIRMEDSADYKRSAANYRNLRSRLKEIFGKDTFTEEELTKEFYVDLRIKCSDCFTSEDESFNENAFWSENLREWLLRKDKDYK